MKNIPFVLLSHPQLMQPSTQQKLTTFINLILQSAVLFAPARSWNLFAVKSAAVFGLVFFQVNGAI